MTALYRYRVEFGGTAVTRHPLISRLFAAIGGDVRDLLAVHRAEGRIRTICLSAPGRGDQHPCPNDDTCRMLIRPLFTRVLHEMLISPASGVAPAAEKAHGEVFNILLQILDALR